MVRRAVAISGANYLYCFTDWRMWVYLFDIVESSGFGVRSMIVWDKGSPGMGFGWRSQHELIMWACKKKANFEYVGTTGNVIQESRTGNKHHTTEKPVALLEHLIGRSAFAEAVYDPFAGSGSTIIAAERQGRPCYAVELSPAYCDVIVERWQDFTGRGGRP